MPHCQDCRLARNMPKESDLDPMFHTTLHFSHKKETELGAGRHLRSVGMKYHHTMEYQSTVTPPQSPFMTPKKTVSLDSDASLLVPPECPRKRRHENACCHRYEVPELNLDCPYLPMNDSSFETPKVGLRPRLSSLSPLEGLEHDCEVWTWNEEVKDIFGSVDHQVQPISLFEKEEEILPTPACDNMDIRQRSVSWSEEPESTGPPLDGLFSPERKRLRFSPGPNRDIYLQPS